MQLVGNRAAAAVDAQLKSSSQPGVMVVASRAAQVQRIFPDGNGFPSLW